MSRESLLDEAITKAKEAGDWQLVEWLRMARGGESAARWYSDKLREEHRTERKLLDENAKLRELAERAWKTAERLCQAFDGPCRDDGVTIAKPCPMGERDEECVYGQLQRELRELGVDA